MAGFTQEMLDKLEQAIAQGARSVRYGDKQVEYMSLEEMLKARDLMRKQLGLAPKTQKVFTHFSKGLK